MSNKVDERITRIRFDNDQFERGIATSIQSLDRLKNKLESTESINAFSGIQRASAKVDFTGIETAVESVTQKFSILRDAATRALSQIMADAIRTGATLVKSLSVDQISAGWQKYNDEVQAVQTIMVTLDDTPMEEVEDHLKKVAWYSDETSYSYNEMVGAMSKLISAGVGLDDATNAVIGLANAAAAAGVSTDKAQQAFYNFSQAFGAGYMQLQDWRSIEMLNMATPEFKRNILQTASAMGKIVQVGEDLYATSDKLDNPDSWFGPNNMRESLKLKWFDSDVMNKVLNMYGEFADQVYEAQQVWDMDLAKDAMDQLEKLGIAVDNVSNKAFRAAQEAKTFSEAIEATRDAVSTKWKQTFTMLFGNYEEAKVLWSDLAEYLYDLFAASGDTRNAIIEMWNNPKQLFAPTDGYEIWDMFDDRNLKTGREIMLEGLWNILESIQNIVNAIKEAWREVFPQLTAEKLYFLTIKFRNFTENIKKSTENLDGFKSVLRAIFKVLRVVFNAVKKVFGVAKEIWPVVKKIGEIVISVLKQVFQFFKDANDYTKKWDKTRNILDKISGVLKKVKEAILGIDASKIKLPTFDKFLDSIQNVSFNLSNLGDKVSTVFGSIWNWLSKIIQKKKEAVSGEEDDELFTLVPTDSKNSLSGIRGFFDNYINVVESATGDTNTLLGKVRSIISSTFTWIQDQFKDFDLDDLIGIGILFVLGRFINKLGDFADSLGNIFKGISGVIWSLKGVFDNLSGLIKTKTFTEASKAIRNFALSVLAIVGAIVLLATCKEDITKAVETVSMIGSVIIGVYALLTIVSNIMGKKSLVSFTGFNFSGFNITKNGAGAGGMIGLGIAVLSMVLAFKWMAKITKDMTPERIETIRKNVTDMAWALAGCIVVLTVVQAILNDAVPNFKRLSAFAPLGFALGLLAMVRVFKMLDTMEINHVGTVLVRLGMLLGLMAGMAYIFGNITSGVGIGMLGLIGSVWLALLLVKRISKMDLDLSEKGAAVLLVAGLFTLISIVSRWIRGTGVILHQGEKFRRTSQGFIGIILMLGACIGAIWLLQKMATPDLIKGGIATIILVAGLFVGFSFLIKQINKAGENAGKGIVKLGILIVLVGLTITMLALVHRFVGERSMLMAIIPFAAIIVGLVAIIMALKGVGAAQISSLQGVIALIVALGVAIAAMAYMLKQDPNAVLQSTILVLGGMVALGVSLRLMARVLQSKSAIRIINPIILMFSMLTMLFGIIVGLSYFVKEGSWKKVTYSVMAMSVLALAIAGTMVILKKTPTLGKKDWNKFLMFSALAAVMGGIVVGFSWAMRADSLDRVISGIIGMAGVAVAILVLSLAMKLIPVYTINTALSRLILIGGLAVVLGGVVLALSNLVKPGMETTLLYTVAAIGILGVAVTVMAAFISLVGAIMQPAIVLPAILSILIVTGALMLIGAAFLAAYDGLRRFVEKSGGNFESEMERCINFAYALGSIINAFASGVLIGSAPLVAESLSEFAEKIAPFVEVMSAIPEGFGKGLSSLSQGLLDLSWDTFLQRIVNWFNGGTSVETAVEQLNKLTPLFTAGGLFYAINNAGSFTNIDSGFAILTSLPDIANGLNGIKTDRMEEVFGGLNTLSECLIKLDQNLNKLVKDHGFTGDSVNLFTQIFDNISTAMNAFMDDNGTVKDFTGVYVQLTNYGLALESFVLSTRGLTEASVKKSEYAKDVVKNLLQIEPDVGANKGFGAWLKGWTDLGDFGKDLQNFMEKGLKVYVSALSNDNISFSDLEVAKSKTPKIVDMLKTLATLQDAIDPNKGFVPKISGTTDISTFSSQMKTVAKEMTSYCKIVNDASTDWDNAANVTDVMVTMIEKFTSTKTVENINNFIAAVDKLAEQTLNTLHDTFTSQETRDKIKHGISQMLGFIRLGAEELAGDAKAIKAYFSPIVTSISNYFTELKTDFYNWGTGMIDSFKRGLAGATPQINSAIDTATNYINSRTRLGLRVKSPSEETEEIGKYYAMGLSVGISRGTPDVLKTIGRFVSEVNTEMNNDMNSSTRNVTHFGEIFSEETTSLGDKIIGLVDEVKDKVSDGTSNLYEKGKDYITNLANGITDGFKTSDWKSALPEEIQSMIDSIGSGYTSGMEEYQSKLQTLIDDYASSTPTVDVGINPVLTDDYGTYANWQEALNSSGLSTTLNYGTEIPQLTQAIIRLEDRVALLSDALKNQAITHSGEVQLRYMNSDDLVDHIQTMIINNIRKEVRG